jgi:hypothetical protein
LADIEGKTGLNVLVVGNGVVVAIENDIDARDSGIGGTDRLNVPQIFRIELTALHDGASLWNDTVVHSTSIGRRFTVEELSEDSVC